MIANATTPGGATAQIEERWRPEHAWLWPSSDKSTAIVLDVLTRTRSITLEEARPLVAGLMQDRRHGIWTGTQGNVWVLAGWRRTASRSRRRARRSRQPRASGRRRSSARRSRRPTRPTRGPLPMPELRAIVPPGRQARLTVASGGPGRCSTPRVCAGSVRRPPRRRSTTASRSPDATSVSWTASRRRPPRAFAAGDRGARDDHGAGSRGARLRGGDRSCCRPASRRSTRPWRAPGTKPRRARRRRRQIAATGAAASTTCSATTIGSICSRRRSIRGCTP